MLYLDFNYLNNKPNFSGLSIPMEKNTKFGLKDGTDIRRSAVCSYQNFLKDFLKHAKLSEKFADFENKSH